jgi:hypothetical protein
MRSSIALGFWREAAPDAAGSKGQGMVIDEQMKAVGLTGHHSRHC